MKTRHRLDELENNARVISLRVTDALNKIEGLRHVAVVLAIVQSTTAIMALAALLLVVLRSA